MPTTKSVAEILANVDLYAAGQTGNLVEALAVARAECPVPHTEADGGYYVVTRYEDVRTVCGHPELFSSAQPGLRGVPVRLIPVGVDPPEHRHFRGFLNPYFSRTFLLRHEDRMREIARRRTSRAGWWPGRHQHRRCYGAPRRGGVG